MSAPLNRLRVEPRSVWLISSPHCVASQRPFFSKASLTSACISRTCMVSFHPPSRAMPPGAPTAFAHVWVSPSRRVAVLRTARRSRRPGRPARRSGNRRSGTGRAGRRWRCVRTAGRPVRHSRRVPDRPTTAWPRRGRRTRATRWGRRPPGLGGPGHRDTIWVLPRQAHRRDQRCRRFVTHHQPPAEQRHLHGRQLTQAPIRAQRPPDQPPTVG